MPKVLLTTSHGSYFQLISSSPSVGGPCQLVSCCRGWNQNVAKHFSLAAGSRYRFHPPNSKLESFSGFQVGSRRNQSKAQHGRTKKNVCEYAIPGGYVACKGKRAMVGG